MRPCIVHAWIVTSSWRHCPTTWDRREHIITLVRIVAGALVSLFFVAPLLWMVSTAPKKGNQAFSTVPTLFFRPTLDNLRHVFVESRFGNALGTSLFTAISSTILALILGSGIAYPLARRRVPGQKHIPSRILSLRIIPPIVVFIPLFLLLRTVGLTGSIWSLVIVYTYMNLPLTLWLMRGFFARICRSKSRRPPMWTAAARSAPSSASPCRSDDTRNYRDRAFGLYIRLERISLCQRPDRRRHTDGAGRAHRICHPSERGMEQHHGSGHRRCPSRLDRSACSPTIPGARANLGSAEMS
jgi:hypothetical protein